jgi:hypothetical protein
MTKPLMLLTLLAATLSGCAAAPTASFSLHTAARKAAAPSAATPGVMPTTLGFQAGALVAEGALDVTVRIQDGAGAKPYLAGVVDRNTLTHADYEAVVNDGMVYADWSELQPVAGGPIAEHNPIDQAIADARAFAARHPGLERRLKLRVFCGIHAPAWAKALGGGSVAIADPTDGVSGTCGRWWTDAYRQAYGELQAKLAAKYDDAPEIASVVVSGASTVYAETMIRQIGSAPTRANLLAAGYTTAADQAAIRDQIDAAAVWKRTNIEMSFNPYQTVTPDGRGSTDLAFTLATMDYGRARYGKRFVLANNSLNDTADGSVGRGSTYTAMYDHMRTLGAPISIQTSTAPRMHDLAGVLELAIGMGANVVELPRGYDKPGSNAYLAPEQLAAYDARLEGR